jgi:predicted MFS family arabinose efflux permease
VAIWRDLDYGGWHKVFATVMAAALVVSFALYQVIPRIGRAASWLRERKK